MRRVEFKEQTELKIKGIKGFMKRKVVVSGTSAKVNCPKEYLDFNAILVILENEKNKPNK
jgi:putative transposon-encoded protein